MAFSAFLLITIILSVFTVPSALALNLLGKNINALNLAGVVSCPVQTLNQAPALLAGLPVELRCGSISTGTLLKTVTTDAAGCYLFALNLVDYLLFDPATCYLSINIASTASCTLPLPTAILKQPIVAVNVVTTNLSSVLGLIGGLLSGLLGGLLGLGGGTGNLLTCIGGPLSLLLPYTAVGLVINGETITATSRLEGVVSCPTNNNVQRLNDDQSSTKVMVAPAGVPVELRCGSDKSAFMTVKTGIQGKYTFDLNLLEQALLDDKNCSIFVKNQLSSTDCVTLLPPMPNSKDKMIRRVMIIRKGKIKA